MLFDIKTLAFITGIVHLLQFLVFYGQLRTNRNIPGIRWWLAWSAAETIGFCLILLRGVPSLLPWIIFLQNPVILTGAVFIYIGIVRFFERTVNVWLIVCYLSGYTALNLFFYLFVDSISMRTLFFDAGLAVTAYLSAGIIYRHKTSEINYTSSFNIMLFVMHGSIFTFRTIMIISGKAVDEVFASDFFNLIQYFDAIVVGLLWTFGFVLMINQRLNSENSELRTHFEKIFNTSPDAVLITRIEDGYFVDCNDGFTRLSGFSKKEMLNKTVGEVQIWKNPEERAYFVRTLIEKGFCENYETNFRCKDGKVLTGLLSAKIIMLKGLAHILSVTRDISDRKIIETALRESNDKYRELADLLPQIVFETDEKGQLTFVNKHAFKILRYPENFDIYGFNTLQLYIPEDQKRAVENIRSRFSGHPESNNEYTIVRYDSTRINVLVYSNPIFRNNKLAGLRGIIVDITRQKNAEEEIRRKNQELSKLNSLKDKLFSIISHDLRSPFTSILGFSELLQNNIHTYSPETVDKVAGYIKKSANNTFRLLDDLLNWTMTQTSQFIPDPVMLNIPEVIQEVINQSFPLTMEKNIRIFQETGRVSVVASDKNMLTIILRNLITNAIKFTNPNGTIKVSSAENGSFIEITVRDNGIGMLEEIRGKLLTEAINKSRTGTGGEKGNGLGLSISFELIQKLGGELSIESEAGKGSKFTFTIPVVATAG